MKCVYVLEELFILFFFFFFFLKNEKEKKNVFFLENCFVILSASLFRCHINVTHL